MLGLTDPPREHLSEAQVRALLTGDRLAPSWGLELWDAATSTWVDISEDLVSVQVTRNNFADHFTWADAELKIARELAWGRDRVRVYVDLTSADDSYTARFYRGEFVVTTPTEPSGETPVTWDVTGHDVLYLPQASGPTDIYVIDPGDGDVDTYFAAMDQILADSGAGLTLQLDGARRGTALDAPKVWCPLPGEGVDLGVSWLGMMNDLLYEIGYEPLTSDPFGVLRSWPVKDPDTAPVEWVVDTRERREDILHPGFTRELDTWGKPNWWRFWIEGYTSTPTEGDGLYTVSNTTDGPLSQDAVGRLIPKWSALSVTDHAALVAQADRTIAEDKRAVPVYDLTLDLLPIMWHRDIVRLRIWEQVGAEFEDQWAVKYDEKLEVASWTESSASNSVQVTLGGGRSPEHVATAVSTMGTITQGTSGGNLHVRPIRVTTDGASGDVDCPADLQWVDLAPANTTWSYLLAPGYSVGQRVHVTIRNPRTPLVVGQLSEFGSSDDGGGD